MPRLTEAPADLTPEDKQRVWAWAQKHHAWLTKAQVRAAVFDSLEHAQMKGDRFARWDLRCIRWIRTEIERGKIQPPSVLDGKAEEREREARHRRRRYDRATRGELERIGPLGVEELVAASKEEYPR